MKLNKAHKSIFSELKKCPLSKKELVEKTGYSYDGIRGRISEMKKLGFDIQHKEVTEKKYVLVSAPAQHTDKILAWAERTGEHTVKFSNLAGILEIPEDEIRKSMEEIFKMGRLLQLSNDTAKILF